MPSGFTEGDRRGWHSASGIASRLGAGFAHQVTRLTLERVDSLGQLAAAGGHLASDACHQAACGKTSPQHVVGQLPLTKVRQLKAGGRDAAR